MPSLSQESGEQAATEEDSGSVLRLWLPVTLLIPIIAVVAYAAAGRFPKADFFSILGIGLLVSAAAGILGLLVGFLFALPRTSAAQEHAGRLRTNTNLDEVSDWLTKILVGLGLVQLGRLGAGLDDLAETIAPGLGGGADAKTFALGLLVYSLVDGFLIGYLGTRLVLTVHLKEVEDLLAAKEQVLKDPPPEPLPVQPQPTREVAALLAARDEVLTAPPPEPPPPVPPPPGTMGASEGGGDEEPRQK